MALFNNGTGGTLSGITSLEDWFFACTSYLLSQQSMAARNPNNIRNLERNINTSGATSGSLTVPGTFSVGLNGAILVATTTFLTAVPWISPTGGDLASNPPNNEVAALIDAARRIKVLELDSTKNPTNGNYIDLAFRMGSTSGATTNGTISLTWSGFPLDLTVAANGDSNYSGRPYLS